MPINLKGQTSPVAHIPSVLLLSIFHSSPAIFVIHISDLKNSEISHALWIKAMMSVGPHGHADPFSRSNYPRNAHTPILQMIVCYLSPYLLVLWISNVQNDNKICGRPLRTWIRLALTATEAHFKGKWALERIPPILTIIVCYSILSLLVIQISNINNAKISCGRPLINCMHPFRPHGPVGQFVRSNKPRSVHPPYFVDDRVL